jgi:AcrR family transcriptional regulator
MVKSKKAIVKKKKAPAEEGSSEDKIKQAARKVFTRKGFAATRTRDIAEEAGINLALLNYYFRSKQKLFDIVMMENMLQFLMGLKGILSDEHTTLKDKITGIVENYIALLKSQPDLPLFVLHELNANPQKLVDNTGLKKILIESRFFKQIKETTKGKIHPLHVLMNILGLTVFPFIAFPLLKVIGDLKPTDFDKLMDERKKMIPKWITLMLKAK